MATKGEMKEKLGKGMSALFSSMSSEQSSVSAAESSVMSDPSAKAKEEPSVISDERPKADDKSPVITEESSGVNAQVSRDNGESSVISDETSIPSDKPSIVSDKRSMTDDKLSVISDNGGEITIDQEALAIAIAEAKKNPRVPLWSEVAKTLLLYNQLVREKRMVRPKVSLSEEGSNILDEAVREAFPEMCKVIEVELKKAD